MPAFSFCKPDPAPSTELHHPVPKLVMNTRSVDQDAPRGAASLQRERPRAETRPGAQFVNVDYQRRDLVTPAVKGVFVAPQKALPVLFLVLLLGAVALAVAVVAILVGIVFFRFEVLPEAKVRAARA